MQEEGTAEMTARDESTPRDSRGREVYSVHPAIRREAAQSRRIAGESEGVDDPSPVASDGQGSGGRSRAKRS